MAGSSIYGSQQEWYHYVNKGLPGEGIMMSFCRIAVIGILVALIMFGFGGQFSQGAVAPGKVLLTFDDGPNPEYTGQILSILQEYDIKAVFFVVGQEVEKYPELVQQVHQAGHIIGNHTYTHQSLRNLNQEQLREEITKTDQLIFAITGQSPAYVRPPRGMYGKRALFCLTQLDKLPVMWDYGLEKEGIHTARGLVDNILNRMRRAPRGKDGFILLLHDGDPSGRHDRSLTVEALPMLIQDLRAQGYEFIESTSQKGRDFVDRYAELHPKTGTN